MQTNRLAYEFAKKSIQLDLLKKSVPAAYLMTQGQIMEKSKLELEISALQAELETLMRNDNEI